MICFQLFSTPISKKIEILSSNKQIHIQTTTMQLRSGKIVISSNAKGNIELRSGKIIIRSKYTPRSYIKRKKNIVLRSGRLVSHEKYTPRSYIKRKKNIELRSGRLVSHENYKKRPYTKRINISISISE